MKSSLHTLHDSMTDKHTEKKKQTATASMSSEEWKPLLEHRSSQYRLLRRIAAILPLRKMFEALLRLRNAFGLMTSFPVTQKDRACVEMGHIISRSQSTVDQLGNIPAVATVIFPHMRGSYYLQLLEIFLSMRLKFDGFKSQFLVCGGLPICNNFTLGEDALRRPDICSACTRSQTQLLKICRAPYNVLTSDKNLYKDSMERTKILSVQECFQTVYKNIPIGKLIEPSVARHIRRTGLRADLPEEILAWQYFLAAAMLLVDRYEEVLAATPATKSIAPGGWFFWYAIFHAMIKDKKIDPIYYEAGFHDPPKGQTWVFGSGAPLTDPHWITPSWAKCKDIPLTNEENNLLDQTMAKRRRGSVYHPDPIEELKDIREQLHIDDRNQPMLVLFTGLTWDYALYGNGSSAFNDMVEWIIETIRFLQEKKVWVVIRIHPAEAIIHEGVYGRELIGELIHKRFGTLPSNVRIVEAQSQISSYSLIDVCDAVAVMASTIGLETAMMGKKPLILAGYSILNNRGFGIAPENRNEYFRILEQVGLLNSPSPEECEMARRFGYLYLFRSAWPISFFDSGSNGIYSIDRFKIKNLNELQPGQNPCLDTLVESIKGHADFALPRHLGRSVQ